MSARLLDLYVFLHLNSSLHFPSAAGHSLQLSLILVTIIAAAASSDSSLQFGWVLCFLNKKELYIYQPFMKPLALALSVGL